MTVKQIINPNFLKYFYLLSNLVVNHKPVALRKPSHASLPGPAVASVAATQPVGWLEAVAACHPGQEVNESCLHADEIVSQHYAIILSWNV